MKFMSTRIATAFGFVGLVSTLGLWTAPKLMAAIKAALVQNVDEPGRNPFVESADSICNAQVCTLDFLAVPAGKRLVISNVAGSFQASITAPGISLSLVANTSPDQQHYYRIPAISQGPGGAGGAIFAANQSTLAYVDAGFKPQISLVINPGTGVNGMGFTISGYYITLP